MKCPKCQSEKLLTQNDTHLDGQWNWCEKCGCLWTMWQQAEIDRLKLKWETGKPPVEGWYMICPKGDLKHRWISYHDPKIPCFGNPSNYQYAGPIPEPE